MTIELYADGASREGIIEAAKDPGITGFTTNPTLMKAAGVTDYTAFARDMIEYLEYHRPETNISLEVFADDPTEMIRQARLIDSWGEEFNYDVYVKIPVMHYDGTSTTPIITTLAAEGIKLNVTAIFTDEQITEVVDALDDKTPAIISIFAGRLRDIGIDAYSKFVHGSRARARKNKPLIKFLWASSREAYNYVDADDNGVDIITMTPDLIKKVKGFNKKDPKQFSLETCQMFIDDATKAGYKL
jgi:transaldolase